ncbi:MAG: hypothetical protein U0531_11990 [Dehalococcoidia bacterium]
MTVEGDRRLVSGNGRTHPTGAFPIGRDDAAYEYDTIPIASPPGRCASTYQPFLGGGVACLPAAGAGWGAAHRRRSVQRAGRAGARRRRARDPGRRHGHPERTGLYHYHSLTPCLARGRRPRAAGRLRADGFGIYGRRGEDGVALGNDDLDPCHGHTHVIEWDGQTLDLYHYHATGVPVHTGLLSRRADAAGARLSRA